MNATTGQQVNHKCNTPKCFNPEHLYIGTHAQNMYDRNTRKDYHHINGQSKAITCKNGHPFDKVNSQGARICSVCYNEYHRTKNKQYYSEKRLYTQ